MAHALLVIAYHILKNKTVYEELGADYFDHLNRDRVARRFVRRLENLGYSVQIAETEVAA